ncbi:hypothetical protein [Risungbinella massiliensis]|uniref:hypothetical protein n=1 Tax=Risungbinella massiliensis TaxID=1329796 RepID=UPI0005CC583B|nr:hypothetical protein [Risungbinella massiliensis]
MFGSSMRDSKLDRIVRNHDIDALYDYVEGLDKNTAKKLLRGGYPEWVKGVLRGKISRLK